RTGCESRQRGSWAGGVGLPEQTLEGKMARRGRLLFLGRTFQRLECRGGRCVQILNDEALASVDREPAPDTDGSNHNKKMRMQIYSRPSLLTLPGVVLLAA